MFIGVIDVEDYKLTFSNAGHGQQFLLRDETIIHLHTKGIPLGIYRDVAYSQEEIGLMKDDIVVVYSDGITESVNSNEEMFGEQRLIEVIKNYRKEDASEITNKLIENVRNFKVSNPEYDDDMSIGVIKVF